MSIVKDLRDWRYSCLSLRGQEPFEAYVPLSKWDSLRIETLLMGVREFVPPTAGKYVNGSLRFMGMKIFIGRIK